MYFICTRTRAPESRMHTYLASYGACVCTQHIRDDDDDGGRFADGDAWHSQRASSETDRQTERGVDRRLVNRLSVCVCGFGSKVSVAMNIRLAESSEECSNICLCGNTFSNYIQYFMLGCMRIIFKCVQDPRSHVSLICACIKHLHYTTVSVVAGGSCCGIAM